MDINSYQVEFLFFDFVFLVFLKQLCFTMEIIVSQVLGKLYVEEEEMM